MTDFSNASRIAKIAARQRRFQNPRTGHAEVINCPRVWTFLLGPLYLAFKRVWHHAAILFFVPLALEILDERLAVISVILWLGYVVKVPQILANNYLRKGWIET
jgi:hypothetical protein